jgi:phosphoglycolate phosphatase
MMNPIRAVAFDLDGTLVDSAPDIGEALNRALRRVGLPTFEPGQVRGWIGDGPDVLIDRALQALGQPADTAVRAGMRRDFDSHTFESPLQHGSVYEGIAALLRQLQGRWPMVVVTNKPSALARAVLGAGGLLPHFSGVYGADEAHWRKPAPHLLERAAADIGVAPARVLMVGDSAADMGAAVAAGAQTAWAGWGYGRPHALRDSAQWRIGHPSELMPIVCAAMV